LCLIRPRILAIPILSSSAAYALEEFAGWKGALSATPRYRPTFYAIIAAATAVGVGMNFVHVDPIKALLYSAMINGLVAPPLMVLIVLLGSDRKVMKSKVSGGLSKTLTWIGTAAMTAAAVARGMIAFAVK